MTALDRVVAAAKAHNANPEYQAAGYAQLIPHRAEIFVGDEPPKIEFYNVGEGECPLARLKAINFYARFRSVRIEVAAA